MKLQEDDERAKRLRQAHYDGKTDDPKVQEDKTRSFKESAIPASTGPSYSQGRLIHRSEPELKTHTSYLVFAILPRDWTEEDEKKCRQQWPSQKLDAPEPKGGKSRRQAKREAKEKCLEEIKAGENAQPTEKVEGGNEA